MKSDGRTAWPASDAEASRWLREHAQEERRLTELTTFVDVVIAASTTGLATAFITLLEAFGSRHALRGAHTTRHRIGSYQSDIQRLILRTVVVRPLLERVTVVALVCDGLAAIVWPVGPLGGAQLAALAVALFFVGRRDVRAIAALCVSSVVAIVINLDRWWWCPLGLLAGWNLVSYVKLWELLHGPWWTKGPVLGMVPLRIRVRLLLNGRAARLANAVDLAASARAAVAAPFVAACRDLPAPVQPMIEVCRALIALDEGDVGAALALAAHATAPDREMPATVRGWCLAQLSFILEQSGNPEAGRRHREAIKLLEPRSCRRYARTLLLAEARQHITEVPRRDAVALVHEYRRMALRHGDFDLVHLTEMWLARLMILDGCIGDAAVTLESLVAGEDGRVLLFSGRDETANDLLLRASVQLGRLDEARTDVRRDILVALAMLDANTRPLASTTGRLLLAKLEQAAGKPDSALAYAGSALAAAQHGRYMLPSAGWRESWSRTQLDAHATTLAFAAAGTDSALVAEVIELTRGEVLPAAADVRTLSALATLDATATDTTVVEPTDGAATADATAYGAAAVSALQGLSPVRQPPRVRIGSGLRLPSLDDSLAEIALDRELDAIAPRTWYWSAVALLDVCYWAVRNPAGGWTHGEIPLGPGTEAAGAYTALLDALPFARPDEDMTQVRARVAAGPLGRRAGAQAEHALLARVAAAFVPPPLAEGLRAARHPMTLVVSLPTALGHLPVAGLPLGPDGDLRIVERAVVIHMPSWGIVHAARRARADARPDRWPARLAVVAPHGGDDMDVLTRPEGVQRIVRGPLSKQQCRDLLHAMSEDRAWLLTIVGHVDPVPGNAAASGLRLSTADGETPQRLTMNDLMNTDESDRPFEMPERVVLIGCGSIGFGVAPSLISGQAPTSEWLGLGSAVVLAGAAHVCCTLYTVYASEHLKRMTDGLIAGLSGGTDPVSALREVQLAELARWRNGRRTFPVLWLSLAYVGVGWDA